MQLESICGPRAMLSRFTIQRAKHHARNWFNCLIVCPFGKSQAVIILNSAGNKCSNEKKGQ